MTFRRGRFLGFSVPFRRKARLLRAAPPILLFVACVNSERVQYWRHVLDEYAASEILFGLPQGWPNEAACVRPDAAISPMACKSAVGLFASWHCFEARRVRRKPSGREADMSPWRRAAPNNNKTMDSVFTVNGSCDRRCRALPKGVPDDRHSPKQASNARAHARSAGNNTDSSVYTVVATAKLNGASLHLGEKCRFKPLSSITCSL